MIAGKGHFTGQLTWIHLPQQWTSDETESLLLGHTSKKRCRIVFVSEHKYMIFYTENIFKSFLFSFGTLANDLQLPCCWVVHYCQINFQSGLCTMG